MCRLTGGNKYRQTKRRLTRGWPWRKRGEGGGGAPRIAPHNSSTKSAAVPEET